MRDKVSMSSTDLISREGFADEEQQMVSFLILELEQMITFVVDYGVFAPKATENTMNGFSSHNWDISR